MRVFVTGATGFVGKALIDLLLTEKHDVIAGVRKLSTKLPLNVNQVEMGDLADFVFKKDVKTEFCLGEALSSCDVFVHLAGRAHKGNEDLNNGQSLFEVVNAKATFELAKLASKHNIRRFVFLSSIGVNGNQTEQTAFSEESRPNPQEPYAVSKWQAEQLLINSSFANRMEWVIIRPPLVYGPDAPGNFATLMNWSKKGMPLPFGAVHNQRSLIALDNLTDFISMCLDAPAAANQTFVIADDESVSLTTLLKEVAVSQGTSAKLISIPVWLMSTAAKLLGKPSLAIRLFADLKIDNNKAHHLLGWEPVTTMAQQLKKIAEFDRDSDHKKT